MLLIKNGKVLTMAGKILEQGDILIIDSKIAAVEEYIDIALNEDDLLIDAKGLWVMPGIIDAHCHIGISEEKKGKEGEDCNEATSAITPYLRSLDAINTMDPAFHNAIQAGITSVMVGPGSTNIVGGQFTFMKTHGRVIDNMIVLAPAAIKVSFGENPKTTFQEMNQPPTSRMTIAALLREELYNAKQYKKKKDYSLETGEEFQEDFRLEPWIPVFDKKIPLKAHVHRVDDILTAIRIAKEFDLNMTLDHCTEGHIIAEEIRDSGFYAIVGPDLACRNKLEAQNADFKTAGVLNRKGVKVAIMTDHPVTLIQYLPIYAGLAAKKGLGIEEGLKAITINPAIICNVSDRVGSIEVGKDADIAIFTGNPMEVFTHTVYTIINGEIVYKYTDDEKTDE
ncbi:amidohydrolase [Anaerocolumna aminovalerica]|uniref:Imidazolonepropionase n=1 Tax=Anaerocolumna aminovalerica TaxID=1527 RepID=A0A1I5BQV4_9FIRM|nr:amidohydrolase [Anaerocolumna aminovalerica]MBU5330680.1 amidohydrolase [Anaerocolumna aminovalerica]MDU6264419.1 amidohydrolase [Anaerocolumna aminovalerica]SFN77006.1 Imidazolonepropionase [Anaerocolumna aminovalerica]